MFNSVNIPYGSCLLPVSPQNRNTTSSETYGDGIHFTNCIPGIVQTPQKMGQDNTRSTNSLDQFFFGEKNFFPGTSQFFGTPEYSTPDLQTIRPQEVKQNSYIILAANSLNAAPDLLMKLFFSDDNINHVRNTVVKKVKEITSESGVAGTPEGVEIKTPNMDDMFYYMVNIYKNNKVYNGSICFVNMKAQSGIQDELAKLNSNLLQEYVSKLISQINMYIYYFKDASQLPQQLSVPVLSSMKGSKSLEYNTGFYSGNSIGVANYNMVGNI